MHDVVHELLAVLPQPQSLHEVTHVVDCGPHNTSVASKGLRQITAAANPSAACASKLQHWTIQEHVGARAGGRLSVCTPTCPACHWCDLQCLLLWVHGAVAGGAAAVLLLLLLRAGAAARAPGCRPGRCWAGLGPVLRLVLRGATVCVLRTDQPIITGSLALGCTSMQAAPLAASCSC